MVKAVQRGRAMFDQYRTKYLLMWLETLRGATVCLVIDFGGATFPQHHVFCL